jgi:hypothetical protein
MTDEKQAAPTDNNINLKSGYLVGVSEDGQLLFRPVGTTLGVIELLGLHGYAGHRLKTILDGNQGTGDALTVKVLQILEKELTVDNNKQTVDELGDAKGAN